MKIASFDIYRYSLPLRRPITTATSDKNRDGLLIELRDNDGHIGLGECAPLPGFSNESLDDAVRQLNQMAYVLRGSDMPPHLEELSGGFDQWIGHYQPVPSVRFAVESATLNLIAAAQGMHLSQLLCDHPAKSIPVNALLNGTKEDALDQCQRLLRDGYNAFKLKVGNDSVAEDIEKTKAVRETIEFDRTLRLDANRRWTVDQAIDFWMAADTLDIEYIEEPVATYNHLVREITKAGLPALMSIMLPPIALDESLPTTDPKSFTPPRGVAALILKPTLLGLEPTFQWARKAKQHDLMAVVTSSFETSVGIHTLADIAACINPEPVPVGLSTLDFFDEDLVHDPVVIEHGNIDLSKLSAPAASLKREQLTAVK